MKLKIVFVLGAILSAAAALLLLQPFGGKRPTIILMSIDTLRADHLGCYGYERGTSPNIDAFAKEAVLFQHAVSQAPVTAPSHMSLFTGLLPPVHGVVNYMKDDVRTVKYLSSGIATLPEILQQHGYLTVGYHGGANISSILGFGRGFDYYENGGTMFRRLYKDPEALDDIRGWLKKSREEKKSLFLFLHHFHCHDPYVYNPPDIIKKFLQDPVPGLPISPADLSSDGGRWAQSFWNKVDLKNPEHKRHVINLYDAGVYYSDYIFARVIEILRDENEFEDSLIILFSDHGEEFYEHGGKTHGRLFVEHLHVPLIMKLPNDRLSGRRIARPVRLFDAMPTVLDLAGITAGPGIQASSLLPLIERGEDDDRRLISFDNSLKHIRFIEKKHAFSNQPFNGISEWLFDIQRDPVEKINLAGNKKRLIRFMKTMARVLLDRQEALKEKLLADVQGSGEPDARLMEQLKTLGYL